MLGRSLGVLGQTDQAQDAYEKALPLLPGNADVRLEYAQLLLNDLPEDAPLPPRFVAVMREVLAIDGDNPKALFFVGLAEAQEGHTAKGRALLEKLLAKLPADSPEHAEVAGQLQQLK
jgi:cytochrome c-type biogenesis protein CcmH